MFPFPSPALLMNPIPGHRNSHPLAQLCRFPVGKLRHKLTSSETMVTHHLCDTRLAWCPEPWGLLQPWELPSLALQGAPGADKSLCLCCVSTWPCRCSKMLKWLQSPFGYRVGGGAAQRSPSRACMGLLQLGALGAATPAYPIPPALRTQPWLLLGST